MRQARNPVREQSGAGRGGLCKALSESLAHRRGQRLRRSGVFLEPDAERQAERGIQFEVSSGSPYWLTANFIEGENDGDEEDPGGRPARCARRGD